MNDQRKSFDAAGLAGRYQLLQQEGGCMAVTEVSQVMRVPPAEIERLVAEGRMIVVSGPSGTLVAPRWQFDAAGGVLSGLEATLEVLRRSPGYTEVTPLRFFLTPHPHTSGRPLDALRSGNVDAVMSAAVAESD